MTASSASRLKGLGTVAMTIAFAAAAVLAYKAFVPFELVINTSSSIPRGLYLAKAVERAPLERGAGVCFAYVPPAWASNRAYFEPGRRLCKYVAAIPGEQVLVKDGRLQVRTAGGTLVQEAELAENDSLGRPLPPNALHTGKVPFGKVLLLAPANKNSLDSRYLGLIDQSAVSHQIWPLWVQH